MELTAELLQAIKNDVKRRIEGLFAKVAQPDAPPKLRLSALGLCPRATVLSIRTGVSPDLTAASGVLAAGHLFESLIAEAFDGEQVIPQFEVELAGVKGHIDFYLPERNFLIECKTIAAARCSPEFLPVEHHVVQVHAYLSALYEMTGKPHVAALVYFPRENPKLFQVFTFAYDESWHSELVLRIELLKHAIETGEIPPVPANYSPSSFPCRWFSKIARMAMQCPFYEQCWTTEKQAEQTNEESGQKVDTHDMDEELEELVSWLHEIRNQQKLLDEQAKEVRAGILKIIGEKRGRFVGKRYGMTIHDEVRRQLDTKALAKVIDLDQYRKEVKATIVDVFRLA